MAFKAKSEMARIAAIKELLERGYGRSPAQFYGDAEAGEALRTTIEVVFVAPIMQATQPAPDPRPVVISNGNGKLIS